jgi:hypothetical protein
MRTESRTATSPVAQLTTAVALVALLPALSSAQTLEGPESVCAGEEFEVEWSGPNGSGDRIAVANPEAAPDSYLDSRETAEGSPAILQAPFIKGTYELRYIEADPANVLVYEDLIVNDCDVSQRRSEPIGAVLVAGVQTDYGDVITSEVDAGYTLQDFCAASDTIGWAMGAIIDQIESSMASAGSPITLQMIERLPGAPTRAGIENDLRVARDEMCRQAPEGPVTYPFVITYAHCRMAMATPTHAMEIHLPPELGTGRMSMADHTTREIVTLTLRPSLEAVSFTTGTGWSDQISMNSAGRDGSRIGYPVEKFDFEYSAGLGGGVQILAGLVSTKNAGTVWVSDDVPGIDTVRAFYQNLTREMEISQGATSFFGGLISNLVGMLREGLPLEIDQTISSGVAGSISVSGRSHSIITSVRNADYHSGWCSQSLMPTTGYTVTDIDEQISQVMDEAGMSSPEMQKAMQEYQQAMEQMTPEQRQMMEQFGMGDMMQKMMGGAGPADAQAAGAAAAGAAAGTAASRAGGSSMPPSEELNAGNLTESVQRHLQALGYDVGDTDGEMSMETTIAISTFQAEKGMKVTGEVTPQLLGILSAEVDSRR